MRAAVTAGLMIALATGDSEPRVGIVASSSNTLCLGISGRPVTEGTEVTLITPEKPQHVYKTRVLGPVVACERLKSAMVEGPYYQVAGVPAERGGWLLAVAILGVAETRLSDGVAEVETVKANGWVSVRSCASHEGLHLTAWAGRTLDSRRVWHAYWYLGYDVGPSCTKKEMDE
jgi:hypothetical protein